MAFSKDFLKKNNEALVAEKARLEAELAKIGTRTHTNESDFQTTWEDYGDKEDENAAEVAAYSDSLGLEATFESELRDVSEALLRLAGGTYGVCTSCGQEISEARLTARPQSLLCIACQSQKG